MVVSSSSSPTRSGKAMSAASENAYWPSRKTLTRSAPDRVCRATRVIVPPTGNWVGPAELGSVARLEGELVFLFFHNAITYGHGNFERRHARRRLANLTLD